MADNALVVQLREGAGKGVARKLRRRGRIPGVFYGAGQEAINVSLDPRALFHLITHSDAGMNTLIDLRIEGASEMDGKLALLKDLQRDPVDGRYLHADLLAVDLDHTIEVSVPIHIGGTAHGVRVGGGILDQTLRELELECMPRAIPDEVRVDVTELDLGETLHVRDLELPEGVKLLSDGDLAVVSVVAPKAVEEAVEVPEEEAAAEGVPEAEKAEEGAEEPGAEGGGE